MKTTRKWGGTRKGPSACLGVIRGPQRPRGSSPIFGGNFLVGSSEKFQLSFGTLYRAQIRTLESLPRNPDGEGQPGFQECGRSR